MRQLSVDAKEGRVELGQVLQLAGAPGQAVEPCGHGGQGAAETGPSRHPQEGGQCRPAWAPLGSVWPTLTPAPLPRMDSTGHLQWPHGTAASSRPPSSWLQTLCAAGCQATLLTHTPHTRQSRPAEVPAGRDCVKPASPERAWCPWASGHVGRRWSAECSPAGPLLGPVPQRWDLGEPPTLAALRAPRAGRPLTGFPPPVIIGHHVHAADQVGPELLQVVRLGQLPGHAGNHHLLHAAPCGPARSAPPPRGAGPSQTRPLPWLFPPPPAGSGRPPLPTGPGVIPPQS